MAIDYAQQAALAQDQTFRGRVQVACVKYSDSIMLEPQNTPAHTSRAKWAAEVVNNPLGMATKVQQMVITDPAVIQDGAQITDTALQGAVETAVQAKFI
jgi:hypothetical protein